MRLNIIVFLAQVVVDYWILATVVLHWRKRLGGSIEGEAWMRVRRIRCEITPLFIPADLLCHVWLLRPGDGILGYRNMGSLLMVTLSLVLDCVFWWLLRKLDNDDDLWKRRGKKVANKIKSLISGRLVAVSARSEA